MWRQAPQRRLPTVPRGAARHMEWHRLHGLPRGRGPGGAVRGLSGVSRLADRSDFVSSSHEPETPCEAGLSNERTGQARADARFVDRARHGDLFRVRAGAKLAKWHRRGRRRRGHSAEQRSDADARIEQRAERHPCNDRCVGGNNRRPVYGLRVRLQGRTVSGGCEDDGDRQSRNRSTNRVLERRVTA